MLTRFFSILSFFILISNYISAQNSDTYDINKEYSKMELLSDFDLVVEYIQSVHPSYNRYISNEDLNLVEQELKSQIKDGMTELEFHLLVREYTKEIRCGHTVVFPSQNFYSAAKTTLGQLPFDIILLENKVYIKTNHSSNEKLVEGTQICAINDELVEDILDIMRNMQEIDGFATSFEQRKIERLFRTYYLIIYGFQKEFKIDFCESQNGISSIILEPLKSKKKSDTNKTTTSSISSMSKANFHILEGQDNVGVLDIDAFERKGFKKFHKSVFKEIEQRQIDHLIIDLRGNGGGYFPNGNHFLRFLIEEDAEMNISKKKHKIRSSPQLKIPLYIRLTETLFSLKPDSDKKDPDRNYTFNIKPKKNNMYKGKIYVLIDGYSFSMSSFVAAKLNYYTEAIFIGTETGGTESGSNAILQYRLTLPNTKIKINIPHFYLNHKVNTEQEGRGNLPDYEINYSIDEILDGKDKEMEKVIELIRENSGQ